MLIRADLINFQLIKMMNDIDAVSNDIDELKLLLARYERCLHPHHYLVVRAKHYIVQRVTNLVQLQGFSQVHPHVLMTGITMAYECLLIHGKLTPGYSYIRGFQKQWCCYIFVCKYVL